MKNIAAQADMSPANGQFRLKIIVFSLSAAALISGCASSGAHFGITLPVGRYGGIGVGVGTDGRVSGSVGVGAGGGSVSVGTSAQLPAAAASAPEDKKP